MSTVPLVNEQKHYVNSPSPSISPKPPPPKICTSNKKYVSEAQTIQTLYALLTCQRWEKVPNAKRQNNSHLLDAICRTLTCQKKNLLVVPCLWCEA